MVAMPRNSNSNAIMVDLRSLVTLQAEAQASEQVDNSRKSACVLLATTGMLGCRVPGSNTIKR